MTLDSVDWCKMLCDQVDQSIDLHALARMLPLLGIHVRDIQDFMKQKIEELDSAAAQRAAFNVLPIQAILPMDSMQHILSFQHYSRLKVVNKTFKKCFDRNQDIAKRSRQRIVDEHAHHFAPDVTYDESTNQTYVVRPNGDDISDCAILFGTIIPWTGTLMRLIRDESNSGDRILVQDGNYVIGRACSCQNKMLQIIGIGDSVNIKFEGRGALYIEGCSSQMLLRNLNLSFDGPLERGIDVSINAKMWMENCTLTSSNSDRRVICISTTGECVVSVKSCTFINHLVGIELSGHHSDNNAPHHANILGCTFTGCRHAIHSNIPMRCIGNLFIDNEHEVTSPFSTTFFTGSVLKYNDKSICIGNVFEGSNKEFDWLNW